MRLAVKVSIPHNERLQKAKDPGADFTLKIVQLYFSRTSNAPVLNGKLKTTARMSLFLITLTSEHPAILLIK